jgi:hypothetical protein
MKIDPKLIEQWEAEWWRLPEKDETGDFEYIAQRAADYALEMAADNLSVTYGQSALTGIEAARMIHSMKDEQ